MQAAPGLGPDPTARLQKREEHQQMFSDRSVWDETLNLSSESLALLPICEPEVRSVNYFIQYQSVLVLEADT